MEYLPKLKIINPGILSQLLPVESEIPKRTIQKAKNKNETYVPEQEKSEIKVKTIILEEVESSNKNLLVYQKEGIKEPESLDSRTARNEDSTEQKSKDDKKDSKKEEKTESKKSIKNFKQKEIQKGLGEF